MAWTEQVLQSGDERAGRVTEPGRLIPGPLFYVSVGEKSIGTRPPLAYDYLSLSTLDFILVPASQSHSAISHGSSCSAAPILSSGLLAEQHDASHGGEHEAEEAGDVFRLSGGHEPINL